MNNNSQSELCDRAIILGEYILENKSTIRACAEHFSKQFGISKSTVQTEVLIQNCLYGR